MKELYERFPWLAGPGREGLDKDQLSFKLQLPLLRKFPPPTHTQGGKAASLLDLGCGLGYQSLFFHLAGYDVLACDPEDRFLFKDDIPYMKGYLDDLPPHMTFEAILISHVLEHIIEPIPFMETIKSRLKPDGRLFVFTPFTTATQTGHWWKGWNTAQLAVFLCSFGFDCRESFFAVDGYHLAGLGRKTNRENNLWFDVHAAMPWLPASFSRVALVQSPRGVPITTQLMAEHVSYCDAQTLETNVNQLLAEHTELLREANLETGETEAVRAALAERCSELEKRCSELKNNLSAIRRSRSWRLTGPLRWLREALGRAKAE